MTRLLYIFPTAYMSWYFQREKNIFLKEHNFEIHLAASQDEYLSRVEARDGVIVHPITIARDISPLKDIRAIIELVKLIKKMRPDIVHAGSPKGALLGMFAAWLCRSPVRFFACHGSITPRRTGIAKYFYKLCESVTVLLSSQVWFVSISLFDYFKKHIYFCRDKGIVLGNGTANGIRRKWIYETSCMLPEWLLHFRKEKEEQNFRVLGFVGRINTLKGIDVLTIAWQKLRVEFPDTRLLIVGPMDSVHKLDEETRLQLESDPRVLMPGTVESCVTGFCYDLMDIFVLPSRGEGFGMVLLEAGLAGKPVITTNVLGCIDAVDDDITGTIIEPDNVPQLIEAIRTYLNNQERIIQHGKMAQSVIPDKFLPETIWRDLLHEYLRLLPRK